MTPNQKKAALIAAAAYTVKTVDDTGPGVWFLVVPGFIGMVIGIVTIGSFGVGHGDSVGQVFAGIGAIVGGAIGVALGFVLTTGIGGTIQANKAATAAAPQRCRASKTAAVLVVFNTPEIPNQYNAGTSYELRSATDMSVRLTGMHRTIEILKSRSGSQYPNVDWANPIRLPDMTVAEYMSPGH